MFATALGERIDDESIRRCAPLDEDVDDVDARARRESADQPVGPSGRPVSKRCSPTQVARTLMVGLATACGTILG
jgi:hypothetical protein